MIETQFRCVVRKWDCGRESKRRKTNDDEEMSGMERQRSAGSHSVQKDGAVCGKGTAHTRFPRAKEGE